MGFAWLCVWFCFFYKSANETPKIVMEGGGKREWIRPRFHRRLFLRTTKSLLLISVQMCGILPENCCHIFLANALCCYIQSNDLSKNNTFIVPPPP